ncbi:hypothetical protein [Paenibacillus sp. SI8]|uniref:hypothetical protein n=1 Tax=unclassified Paenibacillus TaxID=185978 RepID=UPI0034657473
MFSPYQSGKGKSGNQSTPSPQLQRDAPQSANGEMLRMPEQLLQLQRTLGNRRVQSLLTHSLSQQVGQAGAAVIQRGIDPPDSTTAPTKESIEQQCRLLIKTYFEALYGTDEETKEQTGELAAETQGNQELNVEDDQEPEDPEPQIKELVEAYNLQHPEDEIDVKELIERLTQEIFQTEKLPEGAEELIHDRLENNSFTITSGMQEYSNYFGEDFEKHVNGLEDKQRWLDGGAGEAKAMQDYYKKDGKARTTAIGFKKPESVDLQELEKNDKFRYASGKFFGDMSDEDLGMDQGLFDVITDYNGILSYTKTLSEDLQKYLNLLTKGGTLYTSFYAKINGDTQIENWLADIKGARHEKSGKTSFKIVKTADEVQVPPLESTAYTENKNSNIPDREYRNKMTD